MLFAMKLEDTSKQSCPVCVEGFWVIHRRRQIVRLLTLFKAAVLLYDDNKSVDLPASLPSKQGSRGTTDEWSNVKCTTSSDCLLFSTLSGQLARSLQKLHCEKIYK